MNILKRLMHALNIGVLLAGLRIVFMWSGDTPKLLGYGLVFISLLIIYISFVKDKKDANFQSNFITKYVLLGLFLIIIDVAYNLYAGDDIGPFDYGMLASGFFIILLNINIFSFLKLNEEMVSFTTYFIFILMLMIAFISTGIELIYKFLYGVDGNPFYAIMTSLAVRNSAFFLGFIKPTTVTGLLVDFDGFSVNIFRPCSGVESITIFLSAAIAYFIGFKEKNTKKMIIISVIGIIALYFMNILRIMILVLVGYYIGVEEMLFVHYNLGWVMFALGMSVFWFLVFEDK